MSKFLRENIFNILIFLLLSIQAFMYYYDNRPSSKVFSQKSMSVENFSSIVLSKSGLTKIGSEKLNKIDEDNFFLQGKSYLENNEYKIYGEDISINLNEDISHSKKSVQVINSMGTLDAKGFRNIDSEGKIYFDGIVIFKSHD
ncbi:hypothetical protein HIMB59_00006060 [alpha proteobacterium HIMB59]|jgi:hypothetical protein|nr:hypothetical protein HIMB59_00006060 [alpha proteobacterium HIMB59]|tara:strand:- start:124 stop:552 length:429 start_codon:yes stop_codon:yes gene_type:complete